MLHVIAFQSNNLIQDRPQNGTRFSHGSILKCSQICTSFSSLSLLNATIRPDPKSETPLEAMEIRHLGLVWIPRQESQYCPFEELENLEKVEHEAATR